MQEVYLGIGTNLGDKEENLQKSLELISNYADLISVSSVYETEPMGFESDSSFYNIVVKVQTNLSPFELLSKNQFAEVEMGRKYFNDGKYHSRIIDLDILIYEDQLLDTPELKIPHPQIQNRNFVLIPLLEIEAEITHPTTPKIKYKNYLNQDMKKSIERIKNTLLIPYKN